MQTTNAERLKAYKVRMREAGFKRLSVYVCPELAALLEKERRIGECGGRVLERLMLGEARKRPDYWTPEERAAKLEKLDAQQAARPIVSKRISRAERRVQRRVAWEKMRLEVAAEIRSSG